MPRPKVLDGHIRFALSDAELRGTGPSGSPGAGPSAGPGVEPVAALALDCDRVVPGGRAFARVDGGWELRLPKPPLVRLEYRLTVTRGGGAETVVDPANPDTVDTAFGSRSVLAMPGYCPPPWLGAPTVPGTLRAHQIRGETAQAVPVSVWSPADATDTDSLPLLVVHDGPEYARLASLTRYTAAMIATGELPRHRVALAQPVDRNAWYSASPQYVRTELRTVLGQLREQYAVRAPVVVMGASLGGLTALLAGLLGAPEIGGVFAQSGSFFQARHDDMESSFRYFDRISRVVAGILDTRNIPHPLHVGMTCGALEENVRNNADMAAALARAGHDVDYREGPDLHNYTAWRDSLDPVLTRLLTKVWCEGPG